MRRVLQQQCPEEEQKIKSSKCGLEGWRAVSRSPQAPDALRKSAGARAGAGRLLFRVRQGQHGRALPTNLLPPFHTAVSSARPCSSSSASPCTLTLLDALSPPRPLALLTHQTTLPPALAPEISQRAPLQPRLSRDHSSAPAPLAPRALCSRRPCHTLL